MTNISVIFEFAEGNRIALRASNFKTITYNFSGSVHSFVLKNQQKKYIRCTNPKDGSFFGFLEEGNYLTQLNNYKKNIKVSKDMWRISEFTNAKFDTLEKGKNGDTLKGAFSSFTSNGKCKQFHLYTFNGTNIPSSQIFSQIAYKDPNSGPFDCDDFGGNNTYAGKFFANFKEKEFLNDDGSRSKDYILIGEIATLYKSISETLAVAFNGFVSSGVQGGVIQFYNQPPQNLTKQDFINYRDSLKLWIAIFEKNKDELTKIKDEDVRTYIICETLFHYNMLTEISVELKIKMLKNFVEKSVVTWYFASKEEGFQNRELAVIKILQSITSGETQKFLNLLNSTKVLFENKQNPHLSYTKSLYYALIYRIDDFFGADNFTKLCKILENLVLSQKNLQLILGTPLDGKYTAEQIKNGTKAQFIWGPTDKNVNRINHSYIKVGELLNFTQEIVYQTELIPIYGNDEFGVRDIVDYKEKIVQGNEINLFPNLHPYDLVSIHFYKNPSFIDTSTDDHNYVGENFITFAGFVEYLLIKENTYKIIDICEKTLFAISMIIGFGELVAAYRGLNAARAIVGLTMISSDTAAFLSINTPFRNYLVQKYPNDYQEILANMQFFSIVGSLGSNTISGSGILNSLDKIEAAKFIGTCEAILSDAQATSILNDKLLFFREVTSRVKNELLKNGLFQDLIHVIAREKGKIRVLREPDLVNELSNLNFVDKTKFYDYAANLNTIDFGKFVNETNLVKYWKTFLDDDILWMQSNALGKTKMITFLEQYGDAPVSVLEKFKANSKLIETWAKIDANPLNAAFHNSYIKNIDFIEDVYHTYTVKKQYPSVHEYHPGLQETIANHIKGSPVYVTHNGKKYLVGYTGLHADFAVTEINPITLIEATLPGGKKYFPGPLPTVNAPIQTAIKAGTEVPGLGAKDCQVWMWGYVTKTENRVVGLYLDASGNPIRSWVKKSNKSETTIFVGMNEDKTLIEVTYARHNLTVGNWIQKSGRVSNEFEGKSSDGRKIIICIGPKVANRPAMVPDRTLPYGTIYPISN